MIMFFSFSIYEGQLQSGYFFFFWVIYMCGKNANHPCWFLFMVIMLILRIIATIDRAIKDACGTFYIRVHFIPTTLKYYDCPRFHNVCQWVLDSCLTQHVCSLHFTVKWIDSLSYTQTELQSMLIRSSQIKMPVKHIKLSLLQPL